MKHTIFFLLLLSISYLPSQTNIDSLLDALPEAKDTLRLQAIDRILVKVRGTDKELAQRLMDEEYELARIINRDKFAAEVHNSNGVFKYFQGELDSSIFYFEKSLQAYTKAGLKQRVSFLNNNIGILYQSKGDYEKSIAYHLKSLKYKEETGDQAGIGKSKINIANIWVELGDYDKAKKLFLEANEIFKSLGLEDEMNDVIFSLGVVASNQDSNQLAIDYYKVALSHYDKIDDQYGVLEAYDNIGQAYYDFNKMDSSLYYLNKAMPMAERFEDYEQIASLNRHIGDVYSAQGRHNEAVSLLKKSVEIYRSLGYKDQLSDSYLFLYEAQEKAGRYNDAYYNVINYMVLRDSIASTEMQTNIVELETKYETEKRKKELVISKAENDRKASRIRLLTLGIGALCLLLISGFYAMRQRVRRNKAEKEKVALELKEAERELDFKRQELTTKVLQLAGKNQFLLQLEEEILTLKSSVDASVSKTSGKISRMIQSDTLDEEEWGQFSKEFAGVHVGFADRLTTQFGTFSTSEMRLASLLRMNLSSKDIANILRISDEGIKKARYRLRKKMNMQKGEDLQGMLLSL